MAAVSQLVKSEAVDAAVWPEGAMASRPRPFRCAEEAEAHESLTRNKDRCATIVTTMPVATSEKITALSHDLGSQRRLAELLGVSPAQVTRWRRGGGIDLANAERVDLLELILASLLRLYSADTAEQWLLGLNPHLGDRRPIDLVRAGGAQELLGAIAVERSGGYA